MKRVALVDDRHVDAVSAFIVRCAEVDLEAQPCTPRLIDTTRLLLDFSTRSGDRRGLCVGPGVGACAFEHGGGRFVLRRAERGEPVTGGRQQTAVHQDVTLEGETLEAIRALCVAALEFVERPIDGLVYVYSWDATCDAWERDAHALPRPLDSVVLPSAIKQRLLEDVDRFCAADSKAWYERHGIPYHRGYLFHGPPGTGKTSLICALAARLGRQVHKISLVAPRLTDTSLARAFRNSDERAIMVFEDVDAMFGKHREKHEEFSVTFSGLLNALDGVGRANGALYVFTSNHADRLDRALRRKGRIDFEVAFEHCTAQQARDMFLRFYPECAAEARAFADRVVAHGRRLTSADLQDHFVQARDADAATAAAAPLPSGGSIDDAFERMVV